MTIELSWKIEFMGREFTYRKDMHDGREIVLCHEGVNYYFYNVDGNFVYLKQTNNSNESDTQVFEKSAINEADIFGTLTDGDKPVYIKYRE